MTNETMNSAIFILKSWGVESTLEYPGYIEINRERSDGSGRNVKQRMCFGDVNDLFGASVYENEGTDRHQEDYIETDLSSDCEEPGKVARAIYEAIFDVMDIDTLKEFAQRAKPLTAEEWGSERQTDAQNGFSYLLEELLPKNQWERFEDFALKATEEEMIAYGIQLVEQTDSEAETVVSVPDNVYDLFQRYLGHAPADNTLLSLPQDSECGRDCVRVITAAAAFKAVCDEALHRGIVRMAEEAVGIYWRG